MAIVDFLYGMLTGGILGGFGVVYILFRTNIIQNVIFSQIVDIMEQMPAMLKANPEIIDNLLEPLLGRMQQAIGAGGDGSMKIGGMKIPGPIVAMGMQILGGMVQNQGKKAAVGQVVNLTKDLLTG